MLKLLCMPTIAHTLAKLFTPPCSAAAGLECGSSFAFIVSAIPTAPALTARQPSSISLSAHPHHAFPQPGSHPRSLSLAKGWLSVR